MKLKKLIAELQGLLERNGDVDVLCTSGYELPENHPIELCYINVVIDKPIGQSNITTPHLLIGGDGYIN